MATNEEIRQQLYRQHEVELRIRAWFLAHLDDEVFPVRYVWDDPEAIKDTLADIRIFFSDGHQEVMAPADMPAPINRHDYEPGEEFHPMHTDPICGVCGNPRSDRCHA